MFQFRMGDVFGDDDLSVWFCTLAVAFNDAVHASVKLDDIEAEEERWFYEWRVAVSHYAEACRHLERGRANESVMAFFDSEPTLKASFENVLSVYDGVKGLVHRIRSEAGFHYPYKSGEKAVGRALRELADHQMVMGDHGPTSKIRDSRQLYADAVVITLVENASTGPDTGLADAVSAFEEAIAAFGLFANDALDAFFWQRREFLSSVPATDPDH
jgi:hypothetical protein